MSDYDIYTDAQWGVSEPDEDEPTYKIVRFHRDDNHPDHRLVVRTGLTLEEAQEWCTDDATHGHDLNGEVEWFDGYTEE